MRLFLSPHSDDETLFGAFTIMRERPHVCVAFDSVVQPSRGVAGCEWGIRREETKQAVRALIDHASNVEFLGLSDSVARHAVALGKILLARFPDVCRVWAPAYENGGHDQHNVLADAAELAFPGKVTHYLTYTRTGGKSRGGTEVLPRSGDDIARKLRALACYTSQLQLDPRLGCWPHFMRDLSEYVL